MSGIIAASSALSTPFMVGSAIVLVLEILAFWMIFLKAGRPGWAAIIPSARSVFRQSMIS